MQSLTAEALTGFIITSFLVIIGFFLGRFYKRVDKIEDHLQQLITEVKVLDSQIERLQEDIEKLK